MNTAVWGAQGVQPDITVCSRLCISAYLHLAKDVGVCVRQVCLSESTCGSRLAVPGGRGGGEEVTRWGSDSTCPWSVYVIVCISNNVVSEYV